MTCHACGAPLTATARFCHKCGAQVAGAQASGWRVGLPWAVAGAALGALVTVLLLRLGAGSGGELPDAASVSDDASRIPPPASRSSPPDISQMSPEERATRLYNRVMTLHSQGKSDSAGLFLPMALQAYAMLPALDVDARYHVGVLDLTGGDYAAALAQADSIRRAVPTHLFAFMLRARALGLRRDPARAHRPDRAFVPHDAAERARNRTQTHHHPQTLSASPLQA